jgi:hypothetical protein
MQIKTGKKVLWASFISYFENQNNKCLDERQRVCDYYRYVINKYAVDEP